SAPVGNQSSTKAEIIREFGISSSMNTESLIDTDMYDIFTTESPSEDTSYLYLQGTLTNGNLLYARTSLQSIEESVTISNRFFLYVSMAVLGVMMIVMYFITKSFMAPILELSRLAEEMAELKFDRQYTGNRTDEIGKMGQSMNYLSKSLERSLGELKSANIKLQADLEKKVKEEERRKAFISNVSHELKTPISLIQGYAEGLSENINDDQEGREFYCGVIIDEANKMSDMVKKLLDLNQLEAGDSDVVMEHFNVTDLIGNILNNSNILFIQKGAKLVFDDNGPVYAWGDVELVAEVFTNYLSNALNHVEDDMIIEIGIRDNGDTVRVSVFNTGEQIPEDEIDNIWDKFYKVDKARTREYGGSGVGLSIVKAAMDNMGQKYGVINRENGVEFWFELDAQNYREESDEGQEV
ncbi:MAG: HAMP domain-containing histidine kinase, partial [Lachnospiraceae bacterium]|nr:HAMP domain-containing histidine kinase [Lachnospiraceae bacterium]